MKTTKLMINKETTGIASMKKKNGWLLYDPIVSKALCGSHDNNAHLKKKWWCLHLSVDLKKSISRPMNWIRLTPAGYHFLVGIFFNMSRIQKKFSIQQSLFDEEKGYDWSLVTLLLGGKNVGNWWQQDEPDKNTLHLTKKYSGTNGPTAVRTFSKIFYQ